MSFFSLPVEIVRCIAGSWLRIHDIARLDSALCGKNARKEFLSMLRGLTGTHPMENQTANRVFADQWFNWLLSKGISISHLEIYQLSCDPRMMKTELYFDQLKSMMEITCHNFSPLKYAWLEPILVMSTNLLAINIHNCELHSSLVKHIAEFCPKLRKFTSCYAPESIDVSLQSIIDSCEAFDELILIDTNVEIGGVLPLMQRGQKVLVLGSDEDPLPLSEPLFEVTRQRADDIIMQQFGAYSGYNSAECFEIFAEKFAGIGPFCLDFGTCIGVGQLKHHSIHLVSLTLQDCSSMCGDSLCALLQFPHLILLDLANNCAITTMSPIRNEKLIKLHLTSFTTLQYPTVVSIIKCCTHLTRLKLLSMGNIDKSELSGAYRHRQTLLIE